MLNIGWGVYTFATIQSALPVSRHNFGFLVLLKKIQLFQFQVPSKIWSPPLHSTSFPPHCSPFSTPRTPPTDHTLTTSPTCLHIFTRMFLWTYSDSRTAEKLLPKSMFEGQNMLILVIRTMTNQLDISIFAKILWSWNIRPCHFSMSIMLTRFAFFFFFPSKVKYCQS